MDISAVCAPPPPPLWIRKVHMDMIRTPNLCVSQSAPPPGTEIPYFDPK